MHGRQVVVEWVAHEPHDEWVLVKRLLCSMTNMILLVKTVMIWDVNRTNRRRIRRTSAAITKGKPIESVLKKWQTY